jgi:hypothetical protein
MLFTVELRLERGGRQRRQPVAAADHLAIRIDDRIGGIVASILQEFLQRGSQQQHRRITRFPALRDDRIGQQRHQCQQLLVPLDRLVAGRAVIEPGVDQRQQQQRSDQHEQQPPAQSRRDA